MDEQQLHQLLADIAADLSADEDLQRLTGRLEELCGERLALQQHIAALRDTAIAAPSEHSRAVDALVRGQPQLTSGGKTLAAAVGDGATQERLLAAAIARLEGEIAKRRRDLYRSNHAARAERLQQDAGVAALRMLVDFSRLFVAAHEAATQIGTAAGVDAPRTHMPLAARSSMVACALDTMVRAGVTVPDDLANEIRAAAQAGGSDEVIAAQRESRAALKAARAARVHRMAEQAAKRLALKRAAFLHELGIDPQGQRPVGWSAAV